MEGNAAQRRMLYWCGAWGMMHRGMVHERDDSGGHAQGVMHMLHMMMPGGESLVKF